MKKPNAIQWLWRVAGRKKYYVCTLMLVQALHGGSGVLYALLLRNIVNSAVDGNRSLFWSNCIWTILLVLGQVLLRAVIRYLEEQSRSSVENQLKSRLLSNILHKDFSSVNAVHSAEWLNRLTNDCMVVANHFTEVLPGISGMVIKLVSAAVMVVALQPKFAAILIPAGFLLLFLTYVFRKTLKRLHKRIQQEDGKLRIFLQERIGSLMMIHSFSAEQQMEADAAAHMAAHKTARMRKNHFSNLCNVGFQTGMQGMYLLGVIYCGYGILTDAISYGTLTAITQLISQIQSPFANISGYLPKIYAMTASAERLMDIELFENDCDEPTKPIQAMLDYYDASFAEFGLEHVDFTYLPASESVGNQSKAAMPVVLHNISLSIQKGEYAAFTGHSGCGKSTVLKLLMCIYKPDTGTRFIADAQGSRQNLNAAWHRLFAYVPQGNQLMSGTIREVICFADMAALHDDDRIWEALKIACADDFVRGLDDGVDTLLGERGTGLSEGQMQRIAIARAIFSKSPIMLLDEATSALDERTEKQVLENLRNMTDKTVLIVTHRPAALDICDRILEFTENGVIEKHGTK